MSAWTRERTIQAATIIRARMPEADRAYFGGDALLNHPQAIDVLEFFHRDTIFFDVPPPTEGQRVKVLEAEIARLKRKAGGRMTTTAPALGEARGEEDG